MFPLETLRIDLIPATLALLDAELESHARLASRLSAHILEGWPPGQYDTSAIRHFRDRLAENPEAVGWHAPWRPGGEEPRILVGAGGFFGPPEANGLIEIGFSILPAFEGQGYATELVRALVRHTLATGHVSRIVAHTTRENVGSIRVLQKAGFLFSGPGQDPGGVEYERRAHPA